jgi:uncharacterized membrane protein
MNKRTLIVGAIGGLVGLALANSSIAAEQKTKNEKCYGVAKAGKNDCQTSRSACAGTSTRDGQKDAWIFLPAGTCEKIVGGSLKSS